MNEDVYPGDLDKSLHDPGDIALSIQDFVNPGAVFRLAAVYFDPDNTESIFDLDREEALEFARRRLRRSYRPDRSMNRWFTIDLLGLTNSTSSRSERVAWRRAIATLSSQSHRDRSDVQFETSSSFPYEGLFRTVRRGSRIESRGFDINELRLIEPRWPAGRGARLWFRLAEPEFDDYFEPTLRFFDEYRPDDLADFAATTDREEAWRSPFGHYLHWLFCGPARLTGRLPKM